ncbi:MAG TPA: class I SAM-dependent methyltransferase [Polyangia bacterium]|nr:class I SAM-dependent methyltransferase [Polyangia bacterium]
MSAAGPPSDPMTLPGPWNAVAEAYDEEFFARTPELVARALEILSVSRESRVLDVGAGPGALPVVLAPRVARVVAVDFAENMVERLRQHLAACQLTNVEALTMDGQAMTFPDQSFDTVVSMFGWFLFADRRAGLNEFRRVLRPGGQVLVTSWSAIDRNTGLNAAMDSLRAAVPDLPRPSGPLPTQQPEVCAAEMRAAGFRDVVADVLDVPMRMESVDEYWRVFERAGAPIVLLKQKLGAGWSGVRQDVLARLRDKAGGGPVVAQLSAIYTHGRR